MREGKLSEGELEFNIIILFAGNLGRHQNGLWNACCRRANKSKFALIR